MSRAGFLAQFESVFSNDGKVLICCAGKAIKLYSVKSGELVGMLVGHEGIVTGIVLHPMNSLRLISASLDGSLRIWDYYDGVCLQVIGM